MSVLLATFLCYAGLAVLALALDRHHYQVWRRTPSPKARLLLRTFGLSSLAASLAICIEGQGTGLGILAWLGLLTITSLLIALLFTYRPGIVGGYIK